MALRFNDNFRLYFKKTLILIIIIMINDELARRMEKNTDMN